MRVVDNAENVSGSRAAKAARQLSRIGYDRVAGFLDDRVETWRYRGESWAALDREHP